MQGWSALADQVGAQAAGVEPAAKAWALGDLAANLSDPVERALVLAVAKEETGYTPLGGRSLRPLAILGGLGRRALAKGGAPLLDGRRAALAALRLGLFGR
jgi:phytoene synthase